MALQDYKALRTALFVKLDIDEYYSGGLYVPQTLTFSDNGWDVTIDGVNYTALGNLLAVSQSASELRVSSDTLTLTISGIPNTSIEEIVRSRIKGSNIEISRGWFDIDGTFINEVDTTNPIGRWKGYVNNYSLNEEWDAVRRESSNTIQFECQSWIDLLKIKTAGRKTNQKSMRKHFPADPSFDRVWSLANSNFDFGKIRT